MRVLVIDGDDECRAMFRAIFESSGATVATATGARDGVRAFHAFAPDVVVSDLAIPDEDGYRLVREIRDIAARAGRRLHAIAVTAYTDRHTMRRAVGAGFHAYLEKPVDPWELCAMVASVARPASLASR
ncbi:MAG TPA: response regulator [Methylomirabilota bacterium]|jgi:CheY-like chemotaxis protein